MSVPGNGPTVHEPSPAPEASRRRRRRRLVVAVLAVLVLLFVVACAWLWYEIDPPGSSGSAVGVELKPGWGVSQIADRLETSGVIGSSLAFQLYSRLTGAGPFRAGRYELHRNLGVRDAARALERGPGADVALVVFPGTTVGQVAERVGKLPRMDGARFLALARSGAIRSAYEPPTVGSLEGLLAPSTYPVGRHDTEESLLRRMVVRFDERSTASGLTNARAVGMTPYQAVIVASLIQTEVKLDQDRPLVAAVVVNRVRDGMPLQIDSTLVYARGTPGPVTNTDKLINSPYNTYKVIGLPPTPISTVSGASLRAALAPANVPYRFYVLIDKSGKHAFAVTYAEHLRNVAVAREKGLIR